MCGIVGMLDLNGRRDVSRELLSRINEAQHHRGPDECGLHVEPGVGLGHRRLSIIDVSTGQQPLYNEDGSVVIVYNGEIYNYQELIPELTALGHRFRTKSDTEVIVHAWEAWGERCVDRFRGMFAFALWDRNRKTLVSGPRQTRRQAAALRVARRWHVPVRVRDQGAAGASRLCARHRPARGRGIFRARLCRRAAHDIQGGTQTAAGTHALRAPGCAAAGTAAVLGSALHARSCHHAAGRRGGVDGPARRIGASAPDFRGSVGGVPVGRRRLQRRGRLDGECVERSGQHLLDRVCRPGLRRIALCAASGRPLPDAAFRRSSRKRRLRPDRYAGACL